MAFEDAIIIGSSVFLFLLFYLSTKVSGSLKLLGKQPITVEILQPVFNILGWIYATFHFSLMIQFADDAGSAEIAGILRAWYPGITLVLTFMVFYFIISFIYNLALSMRNPNKWSK